MASAAAWRRQRDVDLVGCVCREREREREAGAHDVFLLSLGSSAVAPKADESYFSSVDCP
jgi:hypothetical protein